MLNVYEPWGAGSANHQRTNKKEIILYITESSMAGFWVGVRTMK